MKNELAGLLGLARRAGKLSLGYENARYAIRTQKAKAVLMANDLSEGTRRRLVRDCGEHLPVRTLDAPSAALSHAVGVKCGCLSIDEEGFARKALALCE